MARAASQRLRALQTDAARSIGFEVEPADGRQDFLVAVPGRKFAEAARLVIDAKFEIVAGAGLDEVVDEILLVFFRETFRRLLAQKCAVLGGHELAPGSKPFRLRYRQQLRFITLSLDVADYRERHAAPSKHAADGHEAYQTHEEVTHAAGSATDIGYLCKHDFKLGHHLLPYLIEIGEVGTLTQHRCSKIGAQAHGSFHFAAMALVEGMDFSHEKSSPEGDSPIF